MKKKIILIILITLFALILSFVPIPSPPYKDGETKTYTSLTYKVVKWNVSLSISAESYYTNTSIYWFPNNFKNDENLWKLENENSQQLINLADY